MYNYLKGIVSEIDGDNITLEVNGIGFEILASGALIGGAVLGEFMTVYIAEVIKEDSHTLIGFNDIAEKKLFSKLLGVSGVGAKSALSIVSLGTQNVLTALLKGDANALSVKGVGAKTVAKIIIDLHGKVDLDAKTLIAKPKARETLSGECADAANGLTSLGVSKVEAERTVLEIYKDGMTAEEIIKIALTRRAK
ncbi:MAG: Holliday junction branch migration protein RuvA [Christensenellaceae bacterium]|jgi:Holliday junction DNA helicase RuvA|nr:Holliday junction branch migration protein RuvA [Christensenellaceae bacterium]